MFWTLLALLLMIVLGGFISYYGDLQGRRWGKKRVSWFGLRPKYTAILITSLTGAFIAMMSIATLLLVSPTVRDIVLTGEQAVRENRHLNFQLNEERIRQNRQIKLMDAQINEFNRHIADLGTKLKQREKQLEDAHRQLEPTLRKLDQLEQNRKSLEADLKGVRVEIVAKTAEVKQKSQDLIHIKHETQIAEAKNRRLSAQNSLLSQKNAGLKKDADQVSGILQREKDLQDRMVMEQEDLVRKSRMLEQEKRELAESNQTSTEELAKRQQELDQIQRDLTRARDDVAQAKQTFQQISRAITINYHTLRQGAITVRAGAELGRRVMPAHLHPDAARKQVMELLERASANAQENFKAERGANSRAIRIVTRRASTLIDTDVATEPENIDLMVERLTNSETPVLMVVSSLNNCVAGEQILVDIQLYASITVFKKGECVASRVINSRLSLDKVKAIVASFLMTDVKEAALQAGIVPVVDPVSGFAEIGAYDAVALNILADHIKRLGGNVLLTAVANNTITTADSFDTNRLRMDTVHVEN